MILAEVESCGVALVQDRGRQAFADVGVPVSGAAHRERYELAAALMGDDRAGGPPAIELLAGSLGVRIHVATWFVAVGPAWCRVDGHGFATGVVGALDAGSRILLERTGPGPVYLLVGGWNAEHVLGSAATDTFGGLGPAPVARGFAFVGSPPVGSGPIGAFSRPVPDQAGPLRVIVAPGLLLPDAAAWGLGGAWTVSDASRSGVRLRRASAAVAAEPGLASAFDASGPMLPGAVQVTPAGEAIILGPDAGVTGGYPVAGVVATVDLSRISLLEIGDRVGFAAVDVPTAHHLHLTRRALLRRSVRPADGAVG